MAMCKKVSFLKNSTYRDYPDLQKKKEGLKDKVHATTFYGLGKLKLF